MYKKTYCTTPGVGTGFACGMDKMFKFYVKFFKVMGKALSGELSCMRTGLFIVAGCESLFVEDLIKTGRLT